MVGKKLGAEFGVGAACIPPRDEAFALGADARVPRIDGPDLTVVVGDAPRFPDLVAIDAGHETQVWADVGTEVDRAVVGSGGVTAAQRPEPPAPVGLNVVIHAAENRISHPSVFDLRLEVVAVFLIEVLRLDCGDDAGDAVPAQHAQKPVLRAFLEIELIRERGAPFVAFGPAVIEPGQSVEVELSGIGIGGDAVGEESVGIDVQVKTAVAAGHVTGAEILVLFALIAGLEMEIFQNLLVEKQIHDRGVAVAEIGEVMVAGVAGIIVVIQQGNAARGTGIDRIDDPRPPPVVGDVLHADGVE